MQSIVSKENKLNLSVQFRSVNISMYRVGNEFWLLNLVHKKSVHDCWLSAFVSRWNSNEKKYIVSHTVFNHKKYYYFDMIYYFKIAWCVLRTYIYNNIKYRYVCDRIKGQIKSAFQRIEKYCIQLIHFFGMHYEWICLLNNEFNLV